MDEKILLSILEKELKQYEYKDVYEKIHDHPTWKGYREKIKGLLTEAKKIERENNELLDRKNRIKSQISFIKERHEAQDMKRYDELIKKKLESGEKYFNCGKYCNGWNGISPRCYCENNRVRWTFNDNKDDVIAEKW